MTGRRLDKVIAALPASAREKVEARYRELKEEIEASANCAVAGKAQADIGATLEIKQSSVSKI